MRKIFAVVVAVAAVAFVAGAVRAEETVKAKQTTTGSETKTVIKEKSPGEKTTATVVTKPGETAVTETTKLKEGKVAKETVTFDKIDKDGNYIYVMKDTKLLRLKHTLSEGAKKNMLAKKKGDTITVTSTYPLTNQDLAIIIDAK